MRKSIRIPAMLALSLILTVPALAQSTHKTTPATPAAAKTATTTPNPDTVYLLKQEYVTKTAELRGKITARQAELEVLLASKPDDTAAIKKLTAEIGTLRGQLFEQTTLFRVRFAKETGMPMRMTRHMLGMGGMMDGGKGGCKMMGKDGMGKGMMMGMNHGAMGGMGKMGMGQMPMGQMPMAQMNHAAMQHDMPMTSDHATTAPAKK